MPPLRRTNRRRHRVRLTTWDRAALKQVARFHESLSPKTLGMTYDLEHMRQVMEDVEIYVDHICKLSPKNVLDEIVEVTIHELCHKEGLDERQARMATKILIRDKKLTVGLERKIMRAMDEEFVKRFLPHDQGER